MSIWSDGTIRRHVSAQEWGEVQIDPYDPGLVNPASIDVRLDNHLCGVGGRWSTLLEDDEVYRIAPNTLVLGTTLETIRLGSSVQAQVSGKSSLGRLGLVVHQTAGFIDPGFHGQVTLELLNVSDGAIALKPGMRIAQLSFQWLDRTCERPYGHPDLGSHYQDQVGATPSWMVAT